MAVDEVGSVVTIPLQGGGRLYDYARAFAAIDDLCIALHVFMELSAFARSVTDGLSPSPIVSELGLLVPPLDYLGGDPKKVPAPTGDRIDRFCATLAEAGLLRPPDPMVLRSIAAASPGDLDLIGLGKAAEQVRLGLAQRAERKKDDAYRNEAEANRLRLENYLLEIQATRETVALLHELGFPQAEIAAFVAQRLAGPSAELDRAQDTIGLGAPPVQ